MTANTPFASVRNILDEVSRLKKGRQFLEAEKFLKESLEKHQGNSTLQVSLGEIFQHQGRLSEATTLASEVLEKNPENTRAMVLAADILLKQKRTEKACDYLEKAYRKEKSSYLASRLGGLLIKEKRYEEAISILTSQLEKDPENLHLLRNLAQALKKEGQKERSLEIFEKIMKLDPEDKFIYREYIGLRVKGKPVASAIAEVERLLMVPSAARNSYLHSLHGDLLKKDKQYEEAIKAYEKSRKLEVRDLYSLRQIGYCYKEMGHLARALQIFSECFIQKPDDFHIRRSMESVFKKTGDWHEYITILEQAIEKHPQDYSLKTILRQVTRRLES